MSSNEKTETESEKATRCKLARCPAYGKHYKNCEKCSGPVTWKDERGRQCGRSRSCHTCPNNGLGLPVCWSACNGPNDSYTTDGQSIVTLGAIEDDDSFIAQERIDRDEIIRENGDSVIDRIEGEPDDTRKAYDNAITAKLSNEAETACKVIFSSLMALEETNLRIFYHFYRGLTPAATATKLGISKQAVCRRKDLMTRDNRWMRYFVKAMNLKVSSGGGSNRGHFKNSTLFQPDLFVDSVMQELNRETRDSKLADCDAV